MKLLFIISCLLACCISGARANQLTYTSDPQYANRVEAWEYKAIKAHEIRPARENNIVETLAIDGSVPAIQISNDDQYADLVHAITRGGR